MDPFDSPKFLVRQTQASVAELKTMLDAIFATNPKRRIVEVDPQTGNKTFKIVFGGVIPDKVRHIAATAITDLRHALDQAFCAAVVTLTNADPASLYFPISRNKADLQGRLTKSGMPSEMHPIFLGFQSYPTENVTDGGNDALCALAKAAQGKHRISCQVRGSITTMHIGSVSASYVISQSVPPVWDSVKNEIVLAVTKPAGHFNGDFVVTFDVTLSNAGPLTGYDAVPTLHGLSGMVESIVLGIEAEAVRLLKDRSSPNPA